LKNDPPTPSSKEIVVVCVDKKGIGVRCLQCELSIKKLNKQDLLNKELLLYLLPIHITIDLGTGVGYRVYLKRWRGGR